MSSKVSMYFVVMAVSLLVVAGIGSDSPLSCRDENGNPVDRWVSLKGSNNWNYYYYNDASSFVKSDYQVDQGKDGMIMATMYQMYDSSFNTSNAIYGMYNDEPPPDATASSTYAHAKGVLVADGNNRGFWLVHSVPKWPNQVYMGESGFPSDTYGQSLTCVSVTGATANDIAKTLQTSRPYIYDYKIGSGVNGMYPDFADWIGGAHATSSDPQTVSMDFKSYNGTQFTQFAKTKAWGEDFWDDLVAPYYKAPLSVETWRSGSGGRMGSTCGSDGITQPKYPIYEVASIEMSDGTSWVGTQDHSKWASTNDSGTQAWCVGDLNRMCSQETRGGGSICRHDGGTWKAFKNVITSTEPCWEYDPCSGSSQCYWCKA